ncbi:helix-turn-helix domain-containing protein [Pedobacter sp.]|uniref:helix-turn-helix domain-containing protein n=1 Tax=Pedobacter sp. TaxID=1411316 RepID=UPI003D7F204F
MFDFSEPYKIDLEGYMNRHFSYNVPLVQFAKLTGRSLSTFKRDFEKIFHATPEKWLQKKRLDMAHYLISQKNRKPTDVYLEVGFENLSHFSTAFKKEFGVNASFV